MTGTLTRRNALVLTVGAGVSACAPQELGSAPTGDPAGCWPTPVAPLALPFAVQEIYPAAHKGRIHVAGGLLGEGGRVVGVSDRHAAFDPATGATAMLRALPWPRHHPQLLSHAGRLLMLGGFATMPGAVTWIMTTDTLAYYDAADAWAPLAPAAQPHAECVAASLGQRVHLVGGRSPRGAANAAYQDHADSTQHLVFDPAANSWTTAAPALAPRNSAAGAVIDGLWHVAGGRTVTGGPTDAHEVYDEKEDRWRNAAPMPKGSGAGGNAAAVLGGALYVFGGEVFGQGGSGGVVHPEVWRYNPGADAWSAAAPMPTPRHGLGAVAVGGSIYTVGGARRPSGSETSSVIERFTRDRC